MSVRLRRLKADYDKISTAFSGDSKIRILKTVGSPPERYQMEYLVTSLQKDLIEKKLRTHNSFIVEITLTGSYPRMAPQCKMLTPVYHPNIAPHAICIGDHWAAGESLLNLMIRIGEMLSYQSYNVKSPLNGDAARWAEKNQHRLPFDTFDFSAFLSVGEVTNRNAAGAAGGAQACSNCGKPGDGDSLKVCVNDHLACPDCVLQCSSCDATLCLKCQLHRCAISGDYLCAQCVYECHGCNRHVAKSNTALCQVCGQRRCTDCLITCHDCGRTVCLDHITKRVQDGEKQYICSLCAQTENASTVAD